jgi:hypothetical protein
VSPASARDSRPLLVRLYQRWNQLLLRSAPPGVSPLLRLERGAGLVQPSRAPAICASLEPLLGCAAARLSPSPPALVAVVRPKLRVHVELGGAGLAVTLCYFGSPPAEAELMAHFASPPDGPWVLPPRVSAGGEVSLRVIAGEPPRRYPVVHVLAGKRPVALPMLSVLRVDSADAAPPDAAQVPSLAGLLHEDAVPASGRPAVLLLRRRPTPVPLRVEMLVGHGAERVLPVGPLLNRVPWLLGCIARDDGVPVLVVDPLALLSAREASAPM